jgi:hypothetical protein
MDWQAFEIGIRQWFAYASGISYDDIVMEGAPEGMIGRPCAFLSVLANATGTGSDEQRLASQGAGKDALVHLTGNRRLTLHCKVRTRSHAPAERALVYLERVRDAMELPSTQQTLARIGVGFVQTEALVTLGRVFDKRQESEASMDILLTACLDKATSETVGTIEQVRISGTVNGTITTPSRVIP